MDCFYCGSKTFNVEGIICCSSCGKKYDDEYIVSEEDFGDDKGS